MPDKTTRSVKRPRGLTVEPPVTPIGAKLIHVEYLNGTRLFVPLDELATLRKAFRFVEPPRGDI